jgi:proteic killer suppression protein
VFIDRRNLKGYIVSVIKSFDHKGLEIFFFDGDKRGIQPTHAQKIADILDRLDASVAVQDMNYPGSNLHQLKGRLKGIWSAKVSGNWRITFKFIEGNAYVVDYMDYH